MFEYNPKKIGLNVIAGGVGFDSNGCQGEAFATPELKPGDIGKYDALGYRKDFHIKSNWKRNTNRAEEIDFKGSCCWRVFGRRGEEGDKFKSRKFRVKSIKVNANEKNFKPKYPYITMLRTTNCDKTSF